MKILVTGVAGFIGSHVAIKLLGQGHEVVGIDNLNDYYDVSLKNARLERVKNTKGSFKFHKLDIANNQGMTDLFANEKFDRAIHLAAQAGVRYSLENPHAYIESNITGFVNILEGCRHNNIKHLVYASSSSVYGSNTAMPFSVSSPADHPVALYGVTKRSNELMAHSYSHLFGLPTTGLRFFTVYGPWGRPDMALFLFTKKILDGEPIDVFNHGNHMRDFTYIDDIATGVVEALHVIVKPDPNWSGDSPKSETSAAPWCIHNIGNQTPVKLMHYIEVLEGCLGKKSIKNLLPLQPGDVPDTYSDVSSLVEATNYKPQTSVEDGIENFVKWYRDYYA